MTAPTVIEVPAQQNILHYTADFIFNTFKRLDTEQAYAVQSPDFSKLVVFLPHAQVTQQFNEALCDSLNSEINAIIPPWSGTLKNWANQFAKNEHPQYQVIGEHARQLLFIEALQQHPDLFKEENQWQVTQTLLQLFDELSLNQANIFNSAEEWKQQLQHAYGVNDDNEHLLYESKLVYTLWFAWQQQLEENQLYDETGDYLSRLKNAASAIDKQQHFICLGLSLYTKTEQDFIQRLIESDQCHVIDYASTINIASGNDTATASTYSAFISEAFVQSEQSIKQRAKQFAEKYSVDSYQDIPFSTYLAGSEEEQIRAIDYYVRLNIINGKNNIAVISEDRRLSRRLRALLERANIQLQDKAGWSLSTTQAASIIERWLECIEEDFSAYPLLDCMKSPFINISSINSPCVNNPTTEQKNENKESYRKNIYRFEHDLIFHENVSNNIDQYKLKLKQRLKRLSHWPATAYDDLIETLDYINTTAAALSAFYLADKKILLSEFINAVFSSLQQLGVIQAYQNDDAGLVLLKTFEDLRESIKHADPALSWNDCRTWLGMALESQHFKPTAKNTKVQLITLEQSSHLHFDCVVIAAAESQHYPGSANNSPLFNQAVRASLGLTTWESQRQQRHELFNRTLLAAPDILITACNEEKGELKPVSPWLELLINFYQLSYQKTPDNRQIQQLVLSQSEVFNCDDKSLPAATERPAPAIPQDLIPERVSASSYQRIINCPYQYFSADGLHLKPLEELSDELKKADYGERIHLILQIFHNGDNKYGAAFAHSITETNRAEAERYLTGLSEKIFVSDLENNVLHRSWLYRWKKHIPAYINWQVQHQQDWSTYLCEKNLEVTLSDSVKIYGRLDRIDKNKDDNTHAIIDYKTGITARQDDIDSGENVQLSVYALLDNEASEVSYLSVDSSNQKVESRSSLNGEDLQLNRENNEQRLSELFTQIKDQQPLHAWGDDKVCRYCNFSGLCRKAEWVE